MDNGLYGGSGLPTPLRVAGVFAGIGGFELAFGWAGAHTSALVEWDAKCQELLGKKFPGVPVYGDVREVKGADLGSPDVLVGGFPCQDISLAGPRTGLAGSRSGLFWEFCRLLDEIQPRWLILENVHGLLSSGKRRDLGAVLGALVDRGYGVCYRVLDAQFFGVPQRRRRVFIVGRAGGDPRGPAQVLLEPESLSGHPQPRRQAGQVVAALTANGLGGGGPDDNLARAGHLQPAVVRMRSGKPGGGKGALVREDQSLTLAGANDQTLFQPVPLGFVNQAGATNLGLTEDGTPPITASHGNPGMVAQPVLSVETGKGWWSESDVAGTLAQRDWRSPTQLVRYEYAVRKLMPIECERLQGFPDGWTEGFADTTRYRMLGNAVAVPVVEWIARRLVAVDQGGA